MGKLMIRLVDNMPIPSARNPEYPGHDGVLGRSSQAVNIAEENFQAENYAAAADNLSLEAFQVGL